MQYSNRLEINFNARDNSSIISDVELTHGSDTYSYSQEKGSSAKNDSIK